MSTIDYGNGVSVTEDNPVPVAAPPRPAAGGSLGQDPAYLAFLRALGAEESDLQSVAQDRTGMVNRELDRRLPEIAMSGDETRRGISGNFESRGLYKSGEHEDALGRQRGAESQAVSSLQGTAADQNASTQSDLLRQLADIQRRRADYALTTAGSLGASGLG